MLARIENDTVTETRDITLADVPEHKRDWWRPVEGEKPEIDRRYYTIAGPTYQIESTRVLRVWQVAPRDLATVKARARDEISAAAEATRTRYVTPGSGKAMSYQQVAAEALTFLNIARDSGLAAANAQTFLFLSARVASGRYPDIAAAAAGVNATEAQWAMIGAEIDRIEDAAKLSIDAAITVEQVAGAVPTVWP